MSLTAAAAHAPTGPRRPPACPLTPRSGCGSAAWRWTAPPSSARRRSPPWRTATVGGRAGAGQQTALARPAAAQQACSLLGTWQAASQPVKLPPSLAAAGSPPPHRPPPAGPADVAAVIARASGLARWQEEAAAAQCEVARVRRALQEVERNVAALVGGAAAARALAACGQ
jgi:hypothetical protein